MRPKVKESYSKLDKKTAQRIIIILVDEDVSYDKRVLRSLSTFTNFKVIDCKYLRQRRKKNPLTDYFEAFNISINALISGFKSWKHLMQFYGLTFDSFHKNFLNSWNSILCSRSLKELHLQRNSIGFIHAHDLYCGLIGAKLKKIFGVKLIYDAHEVVFHRNRKNSFLRSLFDFSLEKHVIQAADEIRVVNTKIAELYCLVYPGIDSRLRVVSNDHFVPHPVDIESISNSEHATIVYVGQGVKGRQLEQLALITKDSELSVHAFFIGEVPTFAVNAQWIIGPRDYENNLVALVQSQRCMMWCCVENICLSYQLALPNKFFQALAVGMPVIVSKDTYLSEIVHKYKIGIVLDDHDSNWILNQIKSKEFVEWVGNILRLRNDLSKGLVVL